MIEESELQKILDPIVDKLEVFFIKVEKISKRKTLKK